MPKFISPPLPPLKQRLLVEASGKVAFRGFVPRSALVDLDYMPMFLRLCRSGTRGFGIPPIEAMAAELPVVATRTGAIPETVRDQ